MKFLSPYIGRAWAEEAEVRMQGDITWMFSPPFPIILSLGNVEKEHFFLHFSLWNLNYGSRSRLKSSEAYIYF